jgi:hypothetical protein
VIDVLIRPATADDRSFIVDSWLKSYRKSAFASRIPDDVYYSRYGHAGFVEGLVDEEGSVAIACLPSDPSYILGFLVMMGPLTLPPMVHYLYVKQDHRKSDVALTLMKARRSILVTAETPAFKAFAAKHGISYEYVHPYKRKDAR